MKIFSIRDQDKTWQILYISQKKQQQKKTVRVRPSKNACQSKMRKRRLKRPISSTLILGAAMSLMGSSTLVHTAHLVFLSAGLRALTQVASLPGRMRVVWPSFPASSLPGLPLQQTAHRQSVVPTVAKATTSSLLGALLQCWHQIMDQLVHCPAKVPGRGRNSG